MSFTKPNTPRRDEKPDSGRHRVTPKTRPENKARNIPGVTKKK